MYIIHTCIYLYKFYKQEYTYISCILYTNNNNNVQTNQHTHTHTHTPCTYPIRAAGCWLSHLACWEEVAASLDPPDAPCSVLEAVGTQAPVIASPPESPPSSSCSSCSSSSLVVSAPPTDGSEWVASPAPPNITLILEDDVLFLPDFASHLSSAVEAMVEAGLDVCLVGWSALRRRDGSVARFTGTHAYLLTPEGARTLLARAAASLPVTLAIDWQLGYWSASGDLALETAPRLLAVQARAYTDTDIRGSAVGDDEEPGLARLKPPTAAMLADLSSEIDVLGRGIAGALSGYDAVPPGTARLRWGIDLVDRLREVVGFLVATPPAETEVRVLT